MKLFIDFDSTIITKEGLDELAVIALSNTSEKDVILKNIKEITDRGMRGEVSFQESLYQRLQQISITEDMLEKLVDQLKQCISQTFIGNLEYFHNNSDDIYVVSGGFKEWIIPVVEFLKIKPENIFANSFIFKDKKVVNYDRTNPLANSGGKVEVIKNLNIHDKKVMIGDGYTDFEVRKNNQVDYFIAYTENIERSNVTDVADFTANSFDEVIKILININGKFRKSKTISTRKLSS